MQVLVASVYLNVLRRVGVIRVRGLTCSDAENVTTRYASSTFTDMHNVSSHFQRLVNVLSHVL